MKILFCDDQPMYLDQMIKLCRRYEAESGEEYEMLAVSDFQDRGGFEADLIFLDVEMPGKTGIAIKDELEAAHSKSLIIFVTNYIENVYDAFGLNVIGFMPKPMDYPTLRLLMKKAENLLIGQKVIEIEPSFHVKADDIRYITMDNVYSDIWFSQAAREKHRIVRKTLSQWTETLPQEIFMEINKSCIVNCCHIREFAADSVIMDEKGEKLVISRRRRQQCAEQYNNYSMLMARLGR